MPGQNRRRARTLLSSLAGQAAQLPGALPVPQAVLDPVEPGEGRIGQPAGQAVRAAVDLGVVVAERAVRRAQALIG